ncbi:SDR family NAD(P)-dependent oxidoreductase [Arcanobacterium bovis]|uniref:SDR family NAD(P)-dependent oxidoreductase n=1 Tax=Arcanobacterium bovis TaxID=2529275 RepID=A0A4Q9V2J2_9ACTO|nr:SDR family NAD(P)-dependent oxidoreductase [Arcanobacterium bovis]TBW23818.1 SDR family NAD(P)-dependent oxidoreductase [Arcanobacterium bovis]
MHTNLSHNNGANEQLLTGRALVTGGTSGMGLAFAKALASKGVDLVLVARDVERLERTAQELTERFGIGVQTLVADLANAQGVANVKERLIADADPVNILINNAGSGLYSKLASTDYSDILRGAQVMGLAPMELGGAAAAVMRERGSGLILTTVSVSALVPMGAYSAIKALVKTWSDSLSVELQGSGVQVVTFMPGWVHTEFHQRTGVSNKSLPNWVWMEADAVVAEALDAAVAGKTTATPSKRFKVISFLAKHAPQAAVRKAVKKLNKGRR